MKQDANPNTISNKIGSKVYRTKQTNDSMGWAKENLLEAPDGSIFLADVYTHARGRQNRVWTVQPGQLLVTFILKPPLLSTLSPDDLPIRLNQLNMAMSLGILEPLLSYGIKLKWPNDFVAGDKKVGGVLMQLVWHGTQPLGVIVGFGLNVNNEFATDDELYSTAISLKTLMQLTQDIRGLYKNILVDLNAWYTRWQQEESMIIYKTWRQHQAFLGKKIKIHQKDGSLVEGTAQQVMPNGDLLLMDLNKKQQVISFFQVEDVRLAT